MRIMRAWFGLAGLLSLPLAGVASDQGHHVQGAHRHGVASLEVAVDGRILTIRLASPLDNIVGFEHAPKNEAQRIAGRQALAMLQQGNQMFTPTPAAGCKLARANIQAPVLESVKPAHGEHGDLAADYRFECAQPDRLTGVDARLLTLFPGMKRIDAAVLTAKGQQAFKLTRKLHYMNW